jgi:hypothetical protein
MKNCKECGYPLSQALADLNADFHVMCFPEKEWREWIEGLTGDKV